MKTFRKIILIPILFFFGIAIGKAQPAFTIVWNSNCELQSTNFIYNLEYALVYIPTHTIIQRSPIGGLNYLSSISSTLITIENWNCDKDDLPTDYQVFASVARIENGGEGNISCVGEVRSSGLRCAQLYDDLTFTVQMYYP
jgi:hypothetical protein